MKTKSIKNSAVTFALAASCIWLSGCATHGSLIVTRDVPGGNTGASPSAFRIFGDASMPQQPFDVLGQVTISLVPGSGAGPVGYEKDKHLHEACIEKMKEEAAAMGGNAVAGIYVYTPENYDQPVSGKLPGFITGMIVNVLENGQTPSRPRGNCVVGVVGIDSDAANAKKREFSRKWSLRYAQLQLAKKGYYAFSATQDLHGKDLSALSQADPMEIASLCGENADLILNLRRTSRNLMMVLPLVVTTTSGPVGTAPGVLGTGEKDTIEATLFSKAGRKITWTKSASGFGATGFLISAFAPKTKEAFALDTAITEVLRGLPSVATTTQNVKFDGNQIRAR